ncbi:resistance protein [Aspergillus sclerotialis]|uniref:Resistance protein n=1 Tax=Aspergillus sclerotialis TaxID=2070753 RepID=A0A3A2ZNW1_9EURO|nr:resistance protein [Aspergillus sclerotialis]
MASTIFAPGVPQVLREFHSDNSALSSFMVSVYVIGFAIGPLVLSPTSEIYGRLPITHASNVVFLIASILCTVAVNMPMLIVFRLVMGFSGCVPVTLGEGLIADLMPVEKRGTSLTIWTIGPLLGPVIGPYRGPVVGGYMAFGAGWRWTLWLEAILGVVSTIACIFLLRETYGPTLLQRKAKRLQKETGHEMKTKFDKNETPAQVIVNPISRPTKMLIRSPIVMVLSLYISVVYSYMYLLFTTFTRVFEHLYGFNSGEAGLAYLGLGVGFCIGQMTVGPFADWYAKRQRTINGSMKPEDRLPPLLVGTSLVPIGLFWYGWSANALTHWIVPIIGTGFVGIGILYVFLPIQMYLIDAYTIYTASAIAANTVVRSIFGATIPLAGNALYDRLGLG